MARLLTQPTTPPFVPVHALWPARNIALTAIAALALGALVVTFGDMPRLLAAVGGIATQPGLLGVFLVSYAAAFVLRAWAWRVLLPSGPSVLALNAFLHLALFANHVFPVKAGEVVRMALLVHRGVPAATAAGSTVLARLLDFVALVLIALVVGPLAGGQLVTLLGLLVLPLTVLTGGVLFLLLLAFGHLRPVWSLLPKPLASAGRTAQAAVADVPAARIAAAFPIVLASWLLEAGALWSVAQAAGVPLALTVAVAATAFTIAFQGVQVTPGGIGVYEASLTGALALYGVEPGTALALALATHALKFAYSYATGAFCLLREGADALEPATLPSQPAPPSANSIVGANLVFALRDGATALARRADRWLLSPALALVVMPPAAWPGLWPALPAGLFATLPLLVAARRHYLPGPLWPVEAVAALGVLAVVGLPAPFAGLLAVILAVSPAIGRRPLRWTDALWPAITTQAVAAGGQMPLAVAAYGLAALTTLVLVRQWWLSRTPLETSAPLQPGDTVAVLLPVHNEAATVGRVIAGVPRAALESRGFAVMIIVVDDGSVDNSAVIAAAAGADQIIRHPARRGLGAALRSGMTAARQHGVAAAVYLDTDGEYDPADLPAVAAPVLDGEADYVLGARQNRDRRQMCRSRRWGNRVFTAAVSLLTGRRLHDAQTGFRAFSRRALEQAEIVHDYNYAQVLTLDLLRKGMRLAHVPISYGMRRHGVSFIKYREYLSRVLPAMTRELLLP